MTFLQEHTCVPTLYRFILLYTCIYSLGLHQRWHCLHRTLKSTLFSYFEILSSKKFDKCLSGHKMLTYFSLRLPTILHLSFQFSDTIFNQINKKIFLYSLYIIFILKNKNYLKPIFIYLKKNQGKTNIGIMIL